MKICFVLSDSDGIPPNEAFHLGLHCLPKNLFAGIQNENGHKPSFFLLPVTASVSSVF